MAELSKLVDLIYEMTRANIYVSPFSAYQQMGLLDEDKQNAVKAIISAMNEAGIDKVRKLCSLMEQNDRKILGQIYIAGNRGNINTAVSIITANYARLNSSMLAISRHIECGEPLETATKIVESANAFNVDAVTHHSLNNSNQAKHNGDYRDLLNDQILEQAARELQEEEQSLAMKINQDIEKYLDKRMAIEQDFRKYLNNIKNHQVLSYHYIEYEGKYSARLGYMTPEQKKSDLSFSLIITAIIFIVAISLILYVGNNWLFLLILLGLLAWLYITIFATMSILLEQPVYKQEYIDAVKAIGIKPDPKVALILLRNQRRERIEHFKSIPWQTINYDFVSKLSLKDRLFLAKAIQEREDKEKMDKNLKTALKVAGAVAVVGLFLATGRFQ